MADSIRQMTVDPEFLFDDEPASEQIVDFRVSLIEFVRREADVRHGLQEARLDQQSEAKAEEDFLRRIIAVKEKRCEQFVRVERARQGNEGGSEVVRAETEKWLQRLERLQDDVDLVLEKHGVTRYEPSGRALPERDDIKSTVVADGAQAGTITSVLKPGYLWRGQILRPAEVVVAT